MGVFQTVRGLGKVDPTSLYAGSWCVDLINAGRVRHGHDNYTYFCEPTPGGDFYIPGMDRIKDDCHFCGTMAIIEGRCFVIRHAWEGSGIMTLILSEEAPNIIGFSRWADEFDRLHMLAEKYERAARRTRSTPKRKRYLHRAKRYRRKSLQFSA